MEIAGEEIKPNSKAYVSIKVTTDLDGGDISIPVHVIAGAQMGPTLALLSTLHGCEWQSIEIMRRIVQQTQPSDLAGTLIVVPVGNPVAFGNYLTRNTPDESDNADLNRVFPGQFTWISELLASKLAKEVMANSDYLIDFHSGIWGPTLGAVMWGTDLPNAEIVKQCETMAKAFGYPCIQRGKVMVFPGPRSSAGYFGGVLGKPCILVEIGGAGFDEAVEEKWIDINVMGIKNVMMHLKMLRGGEPKLPDKYLVWKKRWRVNPSVAGILVPKIPADSLMREVEKGEILGQVISPYSFEVLEELRSPGKGIVFMSARWYPVRPGDWAFGVIDLEDKGTYWVPAR